MKPLASSCKYAGQNCMLFASQKERKERERKQDVYIVPTIQAQQAYDA